MFRFQDPQYLYLLAIVVLLAAIRFLTYRNQRRRIAKFGDPALVRQLMPLVSRWRPAIKFWMLEGALALLIVMLARPQFGKSITESRRAGIETIIAIDVSNSMRAVDRDTGNDMSRMAKAKMIVGKLIDQLSDDKIGLVVFAGDAFIQLPITADFVSAKMFLSNIEPSMVRNQGTDIAAALHISNICFTQQEDVGKAIILITDGEDHEGEAIEAAKEVHEQGRNVYVLGIGSPRGALVPDPDTGSFMIDNTGEPVMSKLNEQMCAQLAQAGGGAYIHVENATTAQRQLHDALEGLQRSEHSVYSDFDEQFQAVGITVLLLLIAEVCLLDRRNPTLRKLKLFKK